MTIQEIIAHINKCECNCNPNVLKTLLTNLQKADNPDLSHITATADKILNGYKSVNTLGEEIIGNCNYNAELPSIPEGINWASSTDLASGKYAIVLIDNVWTLIHN